jgi:hypothetical protein
MAELRSYLRHFGRAVDRCGGNGRVYSCEKLASLLLCGARVHGILPLLVSEKVPRSA